MQVLGQNYLKIHTEQFRGQKVQKNLKCGNHLLDTDWFKGLNGTSHKNEYNFNDILWWLV